ncbi:hypothetical protein TCCBUS3UF1_p170 (plasmid) [Thermus sp. CCB_US3_UF1]|uniref:hypothetical protein n=1 Tax=Thermus sp. CCB_US3_UF1 TaxID=1111069 RepID=UPI00023893FE|nr:hypothetical protein [Thermus sp. CCB_US3_UF1]AEV17314.1 hypothetical protein TCCBUS3UF1_p170 [Thermus sp. CCB_US3_UF1]
MKLDKDSHCKNLIHSCGADPKAIKDFLLQLYQEHQECLDYLYECFLSDLREANNNLIPKEPPRKGKGALCLLALYLAYKKGAPWFPKNTLNELNGNADCQFPRHARRNYGIKILSSRSKKNVLGIYPPQGKGYFYALESLKLDEISPYRHVGILEEDFERLKAQYRNRCATCGAEEGKPHYNPYYNQNETIYLQKGHMNPRKPLEPGNIIPQCQFCNRAYRNWLVFDKNGRTVGVADWIFLIKSLKNGYLKEHPPEELFHLLEKIGKKGEAK